MINAARDSGLGGEEKPVEEAGWKGEGDDCENRDTREREGLRDTIDGKCK